MKSKSAVGDAPSYKAEFAGWILNVEGVKNPRGPFAVELYEDRSKPNICYSARIHPTMQKIPIDAKLSAVDAANTIAALFEECLMPWNPPVKNPEVKR